MSNPINLIDPTGMGPDDWFWNSKLGRVEKHDTSAATYKGMKNIGKTSDHALQYLGIERGASYSRSKYSVSLIDGEGQKMERKGPSSKYEVILPLVQQEGVESFHFKNEAVFEYDSKNKTTYFDKIETTASATYQANEGTIDVGNMIFFSNANITNNNESRNSISETNTIGLATGDQLNNDLGNTYTNLNFKSMSMTNSINDLIGKDINLNITAKGTDTTQNAFQINRTFNIVKPNPNTLGPVKN